MTQPTHIQIAPPCPACFWALTTPGHCRMCGWIDTTKIQVSPGYIEVARALITPTGANQANVDFSQVAKLTSHPP